MSPTEFGRLIERMAVHAAGCGKDLFIHFNQEVGQYCTTTLCPDGIQMLYWDRAMTIRQVSFPETRLHEAVVDETGFVAHSRCGTMVQGFVDELHRVVSDPRDFRLARGYYLQQPSG